MPKKTIVAVGMLAAVGGGMITSIPASAQKPARDGVHDVHDSSRRSRASSFRHYHRTRNFNTNGSESFDRIRIPVNIRETPVVVARPVLNVTETRVQSSPAP
jgi:hypothetical protein